MFNGIYMALKDYKTKIEKEGKRRKRSEIRNRK